MENRARILFEALEAVLEVWPSNRVGVKAGPMMSEVGAFRATDETLRTSEYVYRRMAGYKLSHMLLMRQMADLTGTPIEHMSKDAIVHHFRGLYTGTLILNVGINGQHGARLIAEGAGDLVAFGRDYIANPDLAERIRLDAPLNEPRPDKLDYRPQERSPSTGQTAWTIVRGLYVRIDMATEGASELRFDPHPDLAEILKQFEDTSRRHAAQLESWSDAAWARIGQLRVGDHVAFEWPAGDIVWLFHFDEIHHRGQLSTYLRPMGAEAPSIYGRSGDSGQESST